MRFETSVQRLLVGILIGFGAVMSAAVYWTVMGPETVLREPINYRLRDAAASLVRGEIFDRDGTILVSSIVDDGGFVTRVVARSALYSLAGYSSRLYGVGGAEAAYDLILRGADQREDLGELLEYDLLHLPRQGSDIRLTIDAEVQDAAAAALTSIGQPGGAVVMDARTGDLLAVASFPTIDPAVLDSQWAELVEDPDKPFVNRATQGQYVLGSGLSMAILTAWIIDGRSLDDPLDTSATVPDTDCGPGNGVLTVRDAVVHSCAEYLIEMVEQLGRDKFAATADLFGLYTPIRLEGFTAGAGVDPEATTGVTATPDSVDTIQGMLGSIIRSPLELAAMTAAITNDGNAPQPVLLDARRAPTESDWTLIPREGQQLAVTTAQTASVIADVMRASSAGGPSFSTTCAGTDIGAFIGTSETEDGKQVFFIGFARLPDGYSVVTALAIEGLTLVDAPQIASAGNALLCAALASVAAG